MKRFLGPSSDSLQTLTKVWSYQPALLFFYFFLFFSFCGFSQEIEINPEKVKFPSNIRLDISSRGSFERHENYKTNFVLEKTGLTAKDSLTNYKNQLYNPYIDYKHWDESGVLAANYLVEVSDEKYHFEFMDYNDTEGHWRFSVGNIEAVNCDTVFLPIEWKEFLDKSSIKSIWLKGFVRIDSDGFPLKKEDYYIPLFLETRKEFYKIQTEYDKNYEVQFLMELLYTGVVLGDCLENYGGVKELFLQEMENNLVSELKKNPIAAKTYSDLALPPNEIWMKRRYERSFVLGRPYFEISGYIINIHEFPYGVQCYITHSLNKAVGVKGIYQEPSTRDIEKYRTAIQVVVQSIVKKTCRELKLVYNNNTCNCKKDGSEKN